MKKKDLNWGYVVFLLMCISLLMCAVGVSGLANPDPPRPIFCLVIMGFGVILISFLITTNVIEKVFLILNELKEIKQEIQEMRSEKTNKETAEAAEE